MTNNQVFRNTMTQYVPSPPLLIKKPTAAFEQLYNAKQSINRIKDDEEDDVESSISS